MPESRGLRKLYTSLAMVFASMLGIMFVYELAKQTFNPSITIWESHAVTILFTSIVSVIIVCFPLRSFYREQKKAQEALVLQQEAEARLRTSEAQYRAFVESAEDSIYTVDPQLRYLLINTRHLARRGISPSVYGGMSYGDFHSPEETALFSAQVRSVVETKSPVQGEYEQGGRQYLRKLNPVIDPSDGSVIAVTVISSDITEQKAAEKTVQSMNRKLNLMNDITRHDILNQLTVLGSYLTLAGEQSSSGTIQRYLAKSEHVVDTIHSQILFAREYQKIGVESPRWQNVSVTISKGLLSQKLSTVTIDEQCRALEIYADPLLEKVFYNLADNAIRHAGPQVAIRFSVTEEQDRLLLVCEDNGPGVPGENKENIFLRGFGKNTGLGLFLIRDILAMTGISIRENGVAGGGARFEIAVPAGAFRHQQRGEPA